jgi:hypothetical protein
MIALENSLFFNPQFYICIPIIFIPQFYIYIPIICIPQFYICIPTMRKTVLFMNFVVNLRLCARLEEWQVFWKCFLLNLHIVRKEMLQDPYAKAST